MDLLVECLAKGRAGLEEREIIGGEHRNDDIRGTGEGGAGETVVVKQEMTRAEVVGDTMA